MIKLYNHILANAKTSILLWLFLQNTWRFYSRYWLHNFIWYNNILWLETSWTYIIHLSPFISYMEQHTCVCCCLSHPEGGQSQVHRHSVPDWSLCPCKPSSGLFSYSHCYGSCAETAASVNINTSFKKQLICVHLTSERKQYVGKKRSSLCLLKL